MDGYLSKVHTRISGIVPECSVLADTVRLVDFTNILALRARDEIYLCKYSTALGTIVYKSLSKGISSECSTVPGRES